MICYFDMQPETILYTDFIKGAHRPNNTMPKKTGIVIATEEEKHRIATIWKTNNYCSMPELAELSGHDINLCNKVTSRIIQKKRF